MPESPQRASTERGADAPPPPADATSANQRLLADSGAWSGPVSRLDGGPCGKQPGAGEVPTLPMGRATQGCDYSRIADLPPYVRDNIQEARDTTVHINTNIQAGGQKDFMKGSGVIMGHGKDVTYVATVDHNTADHSDHPGPDFRTNDGKPVLRDGPIRVTMPNGHEYDARRAVLKGEDGTDRSVLVVHTGADTGSFREARFADQPNYKGKGFAIGFPQLSNSPYISMFQAQSQGRGNSREGEPLVITHNAGHSEQGMSGGAMRNERGEVYALTDGNDNSPGRRYSRMFGVPFGRAEVERFRRQLPESW